MDHRLGRGHGMPRDLPPSAVNQVCGLFDRMALEQEAGNNITLSEWQEELETHIESWWSRISKKMIAESK